jgi:hypothetical protein
MPGKIKRVFKRGVRGKRFVGFIYHRPSLPRRLRFFRSGAKPFRFSVLTPGGKPSIPPHSAYSLRHWGKIAVNYGPLREFS